MKQNLSHKKLMQQEGMLFVISAPSGAGKSTLCKMLKTAFPQIFFMISHTTRKKRKGETDKINYFFISKEEFEEKIKENKWLEWAKIYGNYYGTSKELVEEKLALNQSVLLEIDVQGFEQVKKNFEIISIFIMPPSLEELEKRLRARETEEEAEIQKRLKLAKDEIKQENKYKYKVVNDNLEDAFYQLKKIINDEIINF